MPGQATITIGDKQWQVSIADTPWELAQGLGGIPELPAGTGMLFDLGWEQTVQVTTVPMLFPLDIAFFSEAMVITEVYRDIEPGYLITSTVPARYFLEVNAGELEGTDSSDRALVELLPLEEISVAMPDWVSTMFSLMGFVVMAVFITALARDFVQAALKPAKERPVLYGPRGERLPQTELQSDLAARILAGLKGKGQAYRAYVKYPPDKSAFIIIGSIIGGHYSWNPQGFSVWVSSWKEDPEWPRDSILHIREMRPARSYESTEEGMKKALAYVESEFPTFTESAWVSKSIPVHVAEELGILELERLAQTIRIHQLEGAGRFKIEQDRMGNIIITHTERPGDVFLQFEADKEIVYDILKKSEERELDKGWTIEIKDTEARAFILEELWETAGPGPSPSVRVMPKLPPDAYKDILFCEYIRDLIRLGETITDEEARLMWESWQKREPQRLPSVAPREGEYSWLIIDPETGEMMIKSGYATVSKAKRSGRDFAVRRAKYAGEHSVTLRIYDRDPDIGNLEAGVVFEGRILLPQSTIEAASPEGDKFETGEIVSYKGQRVRVLEHIGDRVNIFIPSRQEAVWVKPEALQRIEGEQTVQREATGTCYEDAWRFLIKEGEGELVHGTVQTIGKRIIHAWVETETGYIWEPESGEFMKKAYFCERAKPRVEARYTAEEAAIMAARTKNLGPWTEQERRQYLKKKSPAVIPTEPRRPRPRKDELEFLPDSPEVLAQTIDAIGYRERIDTAFQEAIKRAKGLK